jgi:thermitase
MKRLALPILLIAFLTILIIPERQNEPSPRTSAGTEMRVKQSILQQDLQQTDLLCRTQCGVHLRRGLKQLHGQDEQSILSSLKLMQKQHPHIKQLKWINSRSPLKKPVVTAVLPKDLDDITRKYVEQADSLVSQGKAYESPPIRKDDAVYFVLGVPADQGSSSLVGVVHQQILEDVEKHQRKNLRIVPYPSDKRMNIQSVDADTLRDVIVDHPEDNEGTSHYMNRQVVVKFKNQPNDAQLSAIRSEIGATMMKKLGYTYVFQSDQMSAPQLINYFKRWNVEYAEPHFLYLTNDISPLTNITGKAGETDDSLVPNDALFQRYQWNLPIIETTEGWKLTKGSEEITVAVIDTGVDLNHPDLQGRLVTGVNVIDESKPPIDDVGHGTHVAGVISALVNNFEGVAGMSWYNRVMPVKVLDHTGAGSTYAVAQGIIWAADNGAKVINLSLGNYAAAQFLHDAVKYAFDKDVVLIAATGNDNTEQPGYPAAYPEVFAVSATDINKQKAHFSNFGQYVDVVAPGVNIASTYPNNQYAALSGTSMASPHVAALAALIRSSNPLLKNTEVMEIMRQTAKDLGAKGRDPYYGFGQIDVVNALSSGNQNGDSLTFWSQWVRREIERIKLNYTQKQS